MKLWPLYSRPLANSHSRPNAGFHPANALVIVFVIAAVTFSYGQGVPAGMGPGPLGAPAAARNGAVVHVSIVDDNKKPLKQQSLIRLTNQATGAVLFETTRDSEAKFSDLPAAKYLLEVGAAGYLGMHEEIAIKDIAYDVTEKVTLRRDPAAVSFTLKDAGQMTSKARKQAEKGVQALELSSFAEARKHLEAANHDYPSSSSLNFLLGYLAFQQKDPDRELTYLTAAIKLDPNNLQAQNLLGQLYYEREDYTRAAQAEEIVVAGSRESQQAHKVLANSYLQLKQFEKARENAQWLVDKGGEEGASARLVLGQALANLHKDKAAIQTLKAYLDGDPSPLVVRQVRQLISQLEKRESQGEDAVAASIGVGDPGLAASREFSPGNAGMPPDIDVEKPSVAAGVPCPANILKATANPSKDLVDSVAQFSAIEHMVHENLSAQGIPRNKETRQVNYVVSISEPQQGTLIVQEFRDFGALDVPDNIKTTGLAVLAIVFHPLFRDDFDMRCEGLGDWDGQATWLVHFRQLDEKPSRLRRYVVNGNNYPVRLKGRAWIRADNLQIVHMETDLVQPIPEIRLMTEHTSVSYGPVQFKRNDIELWLPKNAELYVHFNKRRFHRSESFDHFMLFATEATDKAKLSPSNPSQSPTSDHGEALR